jgi:putative transposase
MPDKMIEEMNDWTSRPLESTYAAIFIDAIVVKVRDGQVANRPCYAAIGVTLPGERGILGLWAGTGGEGAKFWMAVTSHRNLQQPYMEPGRLGRPWQLRSALLCVLHLCLEGVRLGVARRGSGRTFDIAEG